MNGRTYYYYITSVLDGGETAQSAVVGAASYAMTDEQLLTSVQEATFRYFWDFGHPVSGLVWGLTFSTNPWGGADHSPANDNGTITPTAALGAMPYTPAESIATLKHFYHVYGDRLWGPFGFRDAFNLTQNWFSQTYLAINHGTTVPVIENCRTRLCWNLFMANPEIFPMLEAVGWSIGPPPSP